MFKINMMIASMILFLGLARAETAPQQIKINETVFVVDQKSLNLSQLVDTTTLAGATVEKLRQIEISNAPKSGEKIIFTSEALSIAMRNHLASKSLKGLIFTIPAKVTVENQSNLASPSRIEQALRTQLTELCKECRFEFKMMTVSKIRAELAAKKWAVQKITEVPRGNFNLRLVFEGFESEIYWVSGQLSTLRQVPVAMRSIAYGERLNPTDFEMTYRDVTFNYDSTLPPQEMLGKKTKLSIGLGQIIWQSSFERERAITRGQVVHITTSNEGYEVSLNGIAEQDGYIGDMINIRNPLTKIVVSGKVTSTGEVSVQW